MDDFFQSSRVKRNCAIMKLTGTIGPGFIIIIGMVKKMNLLSIQVAIEYIELNLQNDIRLASIAKAAGYSMYHFDKLFKYTVGDSVIEYLRKRRLTMAARDLLSTKDRVIDIAVKYGFNSQQAFSLAFRTQFTLPPGQYRKLGKHLVFYEKKMLTPEVIEHWQRGVSREPRIVTKTAFNVIGLEYFGANNHGEIPRLWADFSARIGEVPGRVNPDITMGICDFVPDYDPVQSKFSYLACAQVRSLDVIPPQMAGKAFPSCKYAVFTHRGKSDSLEETYRYIYGSYIPKSKLVLAEKADYELYDQRFGAGESEIDIYIPIQ